MTRGEQIKQAFLTDNPDFYFLRDEIWIDRDTGEEYRPFERYIDNGNSFTVELLVLSIDHYKGFNWIAEILLALFLSVTLCIDDPYMLVFMVGIITSMLYLPVQYGIDYIKSSHIYRFLYECTDDRHAFETFLQEKQEIPLINRNVRKHCRFTFAYYFLYVKDMITIFRKSKKLDLLKLFFTTKIQYVSTKREEELVRSCVADAINIIQNSSINEIDLIKCLINDGSVSYKIIQ